MPNIRTDLIPAGRRNRPGTSCTCEYITIHETDNEAKGANAAAHAKYIKGDSVGTTGWHYTVDDTETVQHIPDGEVANHSGSALGNKTGIGIEICVNSDGDYSKALRNAIALTRLLMLRHNIPVGRVVQHHYWIGKNCPKRLRQFGWAEFLQELEEDMPRYQTLADIPEWGKPTAEKLIQRGILRGGDTGLNLSEDMLRILVMNDRAGLYDREAV